MARIARYVLYMLPGFGAGALAYLLALRPRRRHLAAGGLASGPAREGAVLLFWAYCGGMAVLTLVPQPGYVSAALMGYTAPYFDWSGLSRRVSLIPFSQLDSLFNILGNIIMFLPFGLFATLLWRGFCWKRAAALSFGITAFIECWQLFVGRYFDVDDIIFNALGVFGGWLLGRAVKELFPLACSRFLPSSHQEV